ncbi:MAG: MFS transporter [Bacteroidetes bacterium]|nr:MFS transporter [Bacteroidota bacterium]MCL5025025.1 MFS transporter [Chloroflexota bacterium]
MRLSRTAPRFFYGWVVVGVCFLTLAVTYAISHGFSVFYVAILQEFGWTRADTAAAYSLNRIVNGFTSPLGGILVDRWGPRRLIPLGALILAIGLFLTSQLQALWQYYIYYGVIVALGITCTGMIPNTTILTHWFQRWRGTAVGLSFAGVGAGMFLIVPGAQYLISNFGWRLSYIALAGLVLAVQPTLNAVFQRLRPQEKGLLPDGEATAAGQQPRPRQRRVVVVDRAWAEREWTVATALRTHRFWLLFATLVLASIATQTWMVHQVALMVDAGFDALLAASVFGLMGVFASVGKIIWGVVSDMLNREWSYTIGSAATGAGIFVLLWLTMTPESWMLLAFAALFGIGQGTIAPLFSGVSADIFQGRNFGSIWGVSFIGVGLGTALGPWLGGYSFDLTGDYQAAIWGTLVALVASVIAVWLTGPRKVRRIARAEGA